MGPASNNPDIVKPVCQGTLSSSGRVQSSLSTARIYGFEVLPGISFIPTKRCVILYAETSIFFSILPPFF